MRQPIAKIAMLALVAPLAGTTLLAAAPAGATAATTAATTASDPFSVFKISNVKYTKKAKPGGLVKYTFTATNTGPYDADYYWIGGTLPKGVDTKKKLYWNGPKGTECDWEGSEFWCWTPHVLEVDESDWLSIQFRLKKTARGAQVGAVGAINFDVPHGAEDLDKKRLKELGIKGWIYTKKVKTAVVR
ncbi:DUF11 domain-containing protein [Microtetraspora malaysiensis]|uniref:DUF11 domain-containing protein n=1 Tax=Microtetraspora malaysiensis TaxID=161358 RepID=UPI00082E3598|nr:DUF11 domain-containing protein [Microtetraspora malaysiensis]